MGKQNVITSGDEMESKIASMKKVKVDSDNWFIYYIDEMSNEKWVKEFPHAELQAGGPPRLRLIDKFPWE